MQAPPADVAMVDDHDLVHQGVGAFLKVFDDIQLREDASIHFSARNLPGMMVIDKDEFNKRVSEYEANR